MFMWNKDDLNPEQEAAILKPGSVFLIACPGSGKTRTLTYKIAYELSRLKSNKQFVVAITYTHRAADEIHERIESLGVDTSRLWIGTIHSFCLEWILKPYGIYHEALDRGFRVIDQHEREKILEALCKPYQKPKITFWDCEFYYTETGYVLSCPQDWKHSGLHVILGKYFEILHESRQLDFELILYYAYQLIARHPAISTLLAQLFSFVLIDEYQDTKRIQYSIITAILKAGQGATKAFIVGDPNQAIYQSLGGYPIAFEDFKAMANIDLDELELSRNYRSSERIIEYFGNYNVHNTRIEAASEDTAEPVMERQGSGEDAEGSGNSNAPDPPWRSSAQTHRPLSRGGGRRYRGARFGRRSDRTSHWHGRVIWCGTPERLSAGQMILIIVALGFICQHARPERRFVTKLAMAISGQDR